MHKILLCTAALLAFSTSLTAQPTTDSAVIQPIDIAAKAPPLEANSWQLDGQASAETTRRPVTIRFKKGRVAGFSGCNNFSAGYRLDGNKLTIGPTAGTMMACPPPAMEQEKTFLAALARSAMFTIDQGVLTLSDADNQALLSFSIYAATPLVDTKWRVVNYNNGRRGLVANQSSQKMSARFDSEGQVAGSAGCNNYSATYQRTEATITIGPARTTRKMCAEPKDVMRDEQEYLAALSRAVSFELDGDKLTLFDADNKRVVIFRAGHIE